MILAECGECGTGHRLADDTAGRRFRCNHCRATVTVPGKKTVGPRRTRSRNTRASASDWSAADDDFDDFEDDWDVDRTSRRRADRRPTRAGRTRSGRTGNDNLFDSYVNNPAYWLGVPFAAALVCGLLGLLAAGPGFVISVGIILIAMVIAFAAGVHGLILAFRESPACGLMMMFVPFYALYYLITRWETQRPSFILQVSMVIGIFLQFGVMIMIATPHA